jgi:hypothetical protein
MPEAIDLLNFGCFGVDPINHFVIVKVFKELLVFLAQKAAQVYTPVAIILLPPLKIDLER